MPPTRSRPAPASSTSASRSASRARRRARIHDLLAYGVPFDRDLEGQLAVGREAAHSARRIVHVRGDLAGAAIIAALIEAVRNTPSIRVIEGFVAEALLTDRRRRHRPCSCAWPMTRCAPVTVRARARSCSRPAASAISMR